MSENNFLPHTILLASESPRRLELLERMGLKTRVKKVAVAEDYPSSMSYQDVPSYLAQKKAHATMVYRKEGEIILAGDSIVVQGKDILEKPGNRDEAFAMLRKLSGSSHHVLTGVCLLSEEFEKCDVAETEVVFSTLSDEEIAHYVDQYQPYDKAGSYGIQEWIGQIGITKIEGSYFNVVGLPTHLVYETLNSLVS